MALEVTGKGNEIVTSSYSVKELWQCLPLHLVEDIFGWFSFEDLGRIFWYST